MKTVLPPFPDLPDEVEVSPVEEPVIEEHVEEMLEIIDDDSEDNGEEWLDW